MQSTNPQTVKWRKSTERNKKIIAEAKDVPCADCGGRFPTVCMDFDHRIKGLKQANIARLATASLDRLLAEIAKCDVVCANCHRIRSHAANHYGYRRKVRKIPRPNSVPSPTR